MDINQPFLINRRFLTDFPRHSIYDLKTRSDTRLELRHISLLRQLCSNKGKLVERDFLMKEIWNDFYGADEALTQGISVLRKILADESKELIKTIPKKGYIFNAEINAQQQSSMVRGHSTWQKNGRVWVYGIVSGVVIIVMFLIFLTSEDLQDKAKHGNVRVKKSNDVSAPAEKIKPENVETKKFDYVSATTEKVKPETAGTKKFNYVPASTK